MANPATFVPVEQLYRENLFGPDELPEVPEIRLLVYLPLNETPGADEIQMLEKMLQAMHYQRGEWRYLFHQGAPDRSIVAEAEVRMLFFASAAISDEEAFAGSDSEKSCFFLPSLSRIKADLAVKRRVWDLIKP